MSYGALDIFEQLQPEDVHWLLASAEIKSLPADRILVREDDPSDTIFFVADGLFEVYVYAGSGSTLGVGQLGPGDVIGEISWLDHKPISASVRALEPSSVMALSTAALESKLAGDAKFAARFFRGLATLTAERLRKTTADLRRSQWQSGSLTTGGTGANLQAITQRLEAFKALAKAVEGRAPGGQVGDADARELQAAFNGLVLDLNPIEGKAAAGAVEAVHAELLPFIKLSAVGERCLTKPRGYAGDYRTMAMIYGNHAAGTPPLGPVIDAAILGQDAMAAIRARVPLLAAELKGLFAASVKEFHVTSLGAGPASEMFEAFETADAKGRLSLNCVDVDREALAHVTARAQAHGLSTHVRNWQANLIHLAMGRQELDLAPQDIIYSLNFADSLNDEMAIGLLDWVHSRLRAGGRVMLGSLHPSNPSRGLMDHVLDWRVVHRDAADLERLFKASRFGKAPARILKEPKGVGLLAECVR